ncbi:MAG: hypothetical protein AAF415_19590 [Pseudomonadota bacterium]
MSDQTQSPDYTAPETPGLAEAETLLASFRDANAPGQFLLDAEAISEMSTVFLLAVISATRQLAEVGGTLAVSRPSPVFVDAFSDLGLFQDLMKMEFRQ